MVHLAGHGAEHGHPVIYPFGAFLVEIIEMAHWVRVFFFLLWPLFARAPRHGFLENFLLSARVCKVFFFFVALR